MLPQINGSAHPKFEKVSQVFFENFSLRGEVGASLCVYHRGERVIDLWGGSVDLKGEIPWTADDLVTVFSVTKGIVATAFLMLVDQGIISYDDPIAHYWPKLTSNEAEIKFRHERANLTIADLLNHRSGLLGLRTELSLDTLENEAELLERLESEPLHWMPGSKQGYHGITFGLYAGALYKKITGKSIGEALREEIKREESFDLYLGLNTDERQRLSTRLRSIYPNQLSDVLGGIVPNMLFSKSREGRFFRSALNRGSSTALAFGQPFALGAKGLHNFNTDRVRALELPWANAQGSARGVATLYKKLLTPGDLVKRTTLDWVIPRRSWTELDEVIRKPMGYSFGFVKEELGIFSPHPEAFGHPGAGGALGYADPTHQLCIGYVMNRMGYHVRSPRALALCKAIYDCLA